VTKYLLNAFGGAAGQHACLVADALGMEAVLIHPLSGLLSAYGIGQATVSIGRQQALVEPWGTRRPRPWQARRDLSDAIAAELSTQGVLLAADTDSDPPAPALCRHRHRAAGDMGRRSKPPARPSRTPTVRSSVSSAKTSRSRSKLSRSRRTERARAPSNPAASRRQAAPPPATDRAHLLGRQHVEAASFRARRCRRATGSRAPR
jgi:hypothetical protein